MSEQTQNLQVAIVPIVPIVSTVPTVPTVHDCMCTWNKFQQTASPEEVARAVNNSMNEVSPEENFLMIARGSAVLKYIS